MSASLRIASAGAALVFVSLSPAPAGATADRMGVCARHAPEAAMRSRLPVDIILRVMRAESRGRPRAVSPKGAMGCMQIMPQTWAYLTARYSLGADPYDPRMSMIGGAMYLAELARQFGFPGAWSAYNAGPGRYIRYVRDGVPLPAETIAYTAQISRGGTAPARAPVTGAPQAVRWQEANLFMTRGELPAPAISSPGTSDDAPPRATSPLFPLSPTTRDDSEGGAGS